ncbi:hypothetical protein CVIRNUC_005457 [Coccomyxa viridis]|uniref:Uncharacterized protein n=1 Tax=Coccomyxa viridis TaxID=1274662 RepID=A0AAV1I4D7_9CHLO|nr:hypothetical protein CVIRNUC_005457 [Coccomyxa viridis]
MDVCIYRKAAMRIITSLQTFRSHPAASIREALADTARHITSGVPGCSLAILHIDQKALRLSVACCGGANALVGELVHGLAAQVAEASLLCPHTEAREDSQMGARANADAAAGQGMAEFRPSERLGGTEQQQVQLAERQLLPNHEHIIVGLPPFWAVTSPDAAALRAHFFLRGMSGTHAFGREFQAPCQTAGHLARFAAGQTMPARQGRDPMYTALPREHLKFRVP